MKKILIVGSSNIDFVLRVADMPRKGETIHTKSFHQIPGGKGANQACACGKLGGDCVFLSAVGQDGLGSAVLESLRKAGVDVSRVLHDEAATTGMAIISVNDEGENCIMLVPGANAVCTSGYFNRHRDAVDAADIVVAQLETPAEDIYTLLDAAKRTGKVTMLNPAPAPDSIPDFVLDGLDFLTPNETELERLTGMKTGTFEEISAAADSLLARGTRNILVTVGSRGALLCNKDGTQIYPAFKSDPVDTTAAGDTFNAGLAVALAEGKPLESAIEFANAAASISITRKGAQTSIPLRAEVDTFLVTMRGR